MNATVEQKFPSIAGCVRQRDVETLKRLLVSTLRKFGRLVIMFKNAKN